MSRSRSPCHRRAANHARSSGCNANWPTRKITVDGAERAPITAANLAAVPPDFIAGQPVATLFVTRRSEVIVALVDPADPFPAFHGQGRRLERPGDPYPRISNVTRIDVRSR